MTKRNEKICLEEFEKFYDLLMKEAPEGYQAWFFPCKKEGKDPCAEAILKINSSSLGSWHHLSARLTKEQCIEHIKQGYNIGISARKGDPLIIIDIDDANYISQCPTNTLVAISRKRAGVHAFCWDKDGTAKINLPTGDKGEIRSHNQYVLSCGSYVPFNLENKKEMKNFEKLPEGARADELLGYYTLRDANVPRAITFSDVPKFFQEKQQKNIEAETKIRQREESKVYGKNDGEGKYTELFNLRVSDIVGGIPTSKRVGHPLHDSDTDANFSLSTDGNLGHCWRHLVSLNAVQYLCVEAGYCSCEDAGTPHQNRGISKIRGDSKAYEVAYELALQKGLIKKWIKKEKKIKQPEQVIVDGEIIFSKRGQIEAFWKKQPFFYDRSGIFWLWDKEQFKWVLSDEIDYLNHIRDKLGIETIENRTRIDLIAGFKQVGRRHLPKPMKKTWVQFKNKIYDAKTGEEFSASPEYFVTNPIPWELGESEDTPIIDTLFSEWVGDEWKQTLYQIVAYNLSINKFLQRVIGLVGGGSNGKGTFIKLNYKFLGEGNYVTSELKALSESYFEPVVLYKKLLCVMGEMSHDDLQNSNMIKKLAGEDKISFQYKGKTPFTDENTATCICLTNSLPVTPDKSTGFYRKWLLIDFPNQFKEIKENIIEGIPEIEFNNLAKKSLRILKELYENPKFNNEGNFEMREKRYEERSNTVLSFIEQECIEDAGQMIALRDFTNECNNFLKKRHLRVMTANYIGKRLRDEGFIVGKRYIRDASAVVILNISLKKEKSLLQSLMEKKEEENEKIDVIFDKINEKGEEKNDRPHTN